MAKHKKLGPSAAWVAFRRRHRGHRFLRDVLLYALTEDLVTAVADGVPGFLSAADEAFERDLARSSGAGFAFGQLIDIESREWNIDVAHRGTPNRFLIPARQERMRELVAGLPTDDAVARIITHRHLLDRPVSTCEGRLCPPLNAAWEPETDSGHLKQLLDNIQSGFRPPSLKSEIDEAEAREQDSTRQKQEAYAMWLLLNKEFRYELGVLRGQFESQVNDRRLFPVHTSLRRGTNRRSHQQFSRRCEQAFGAFYRRWGLQKMLTWDLPLPLCASLASWDAVRLLLRGELTYPGEIGPGASDPVWPYTGVEGLTLFLPWHLLRGHQLNISAILNRLQVDQAPRHLAGWFNRRSTDDHQLNGEVALQQKFWLYRSIELVFKRRYSEQCRGRMHKLDEVIASVLGRTDELVRKLRISLARGLRQAST